MKNLVLFIFILVTFFQVNTYAELTTPPENFKVAFIGDQSLSSNAKAVLRLIKDENTDMVLHQGDFDYYDDPDRWDKQINEILGADFPYFASIGNHDIRAWDGYQKKLQTRLEKIKGANCIGELGVKTSCMYKGLHFLLLGVGTKGKNYGPYISKNLEESPALWKLCTWHKNQTKMQTGGKGNEVGWEAYELCREGGAIIATGHEHSYSRTKTLSAMETQTIDSSCVDNVATADADVCVKKGSTFVFVSGISGHSVRRQKRGGEHWAKIYTKDQKAKHGALFIEFNVDGQVNKARGYFKNIEGEVIDQFDIMTQPTP